MNVYVLAIIYVTPFLVHPENFKSFNRTVSLSLDTHEFGIPITNILSAMFCVYFSVILVYSDLTRDAMYA